MNAPEDSDLHQLPFGKQKVEFVEDSRITNAGSFIIHLEDHTLGNIIRLQLLQNPQVKFAGYRKPHPLENKIEIKVQTTNQTKPIDSLDQSIDQLIKKIGSIAYKFEDEYQNFSKQRNQN